MYCMYICSWTRPCSLCSCPCSRCLNESVWGVAIGACMHSTIAVGFCQDSVTRRVSSIDFRCQILYHHHAYTHARAHTHARTRTHTHTHTHTHSLTHTCTHTHTHTHSAAAVWWGEKGSTALLWHTQTSPPPPASSMCCIYICSWSPSCVSRLPAHLRSAGSPCGTAGLHLVAEG